MAVKRLTLIGTLVRIGLLFGLVMLVNGCVSSGTYEELVKKHDAVLAEKAQLEQDKASLEQDKVSLTAEQERLNAMIDDTEEEKQIAAQKAAEAEAEIARQQQVYENLQVTFAEEQKANQVKIEMMKSGVKVNLANDILFPSGSAALNNTGVEVLTRAAAELKKSPYQTIVAGFTDDIAISGKLKEKYPSNWELAGARAASVVSLLEKEGVNPEQLLAISFGENKPVASNETPEGRSKNRRIEIVLRPVPVTTD